MHVLVGCNIENEKQWNILMHPRWIVFGKRVVMQQARQIRWSIPTSIQFSLVFANVGGVTGVWPWTKE
ncbi:Double-stranded RNA-binding protein Staufen 2 [Scomber scombrus]|uniref:Double-stranded RNA-binding protein Staufen 2 n=1 Tax=Scomber scombrus TaxID=13677 RepID=A0AAV1PKK5_SCOSC